MANKAYSLAFKAEAIALGRVLGAEVASAQLGIGGRDTLRRWMEAAGDPPELQGAPGQWQRLFDLAHARAEALLATGKLSAVQLATVMGIAQRNIREPKPPAEPKTADETWGDELMAALEARWTPHEVDIALDALIVRADDEITAGELTEYPVDDIAEAIAYVESLGDLDAWLVTERERRYAETERQLEQNRLAREAAVAAALDAEARGILAAATAWLAQTQETPDAA